MEYSSSFKSMVIFGDSISVGAFDREGFGWVGRFTNLLHKSRNQFCEVHNHAVSGDRIPDILYRMASYYTREKPDLTVIFAGTNDIYRFGSIDAPISSDLQLRRYYWDKILELSSRCSSRVCVLGILPVNESKNPSGIDGFGNKLFQINKDVEEYNLHLREWCQNRNVSFVDWFEKFNQQDGLLEDCTHPNTKGHELLAQLAYEALKDKI